MSTAKTSSGRLRNRRGEGGLLRQDIVRAAADLLDETGDAAAVTLRAVARGAGISAPSIYAHFADPRAILLAVVQQEFDVLRTHLRDAAVGAGDDVVARLLATCDAYLGYARDQPQRYLVMFGGVWDARPAVADDVVSHQDVVDLGEAVLEDLVALLQACVDAGRSTSDDARRDAVVLWVAMHGLAHQRTVSTAFPWPDHVEEHLLRRLTYLV